MEFKLIQCVIFLCEGFSEVITSFSQRSGLVSICWEIAVVLLSFRTEVSNQVQPV